MDNNILGKNIKHLRIINGETQEFLGNIVGFTRSTINDYESGRRMPTPEILNTIAAHYGKTVDEIMYADLTTLENLEFQKQTLTDTFFLVKRIIPYFSSEKALNNKNFKRAYTLTEKLFSSLQQGEIVRGTMISDIFQLYLQAFEESEEVEVCANLLWSIFYWWTQIFNTEEMINFHYKMKSEDIDLMKLSKIYKTATNENFEKQQNFIDEFDELITALIKVLKSEPEWANLADYYLALRYLFSIVNTDYSKQMNVAIGIQMMLSFKNMDNPYAIDYFRICSEI